VVVLAVVGINFLLPQRSGPIDLTEAWEQFFVASALLAVLVVTSVARYGTQWVSLPEAGHAKVSVAAWNVEAGADASSRVVSGLSGIEVDMIGLEEFQPAMQDALVANHVISLSYPFHVFAPDDGSLGAPLISRWADRPAADVDPPDVHPRADPAANLRRACRLRRPPAAARDHRPRWSASFV
jgi:hypothetical protein